MGGNAEIELLIHSEVVDFVLSDAEKANGEYLNASSEQYVWSE